MVITLVAFEKNKQYGTADCYFFNTQKFSSKQIAFKNQMKVKFQKDYCKPGDLIQCV